MPPFLPVSSTPLIRDREVRPGLPQLSRSAVTLVAWRSQEVGFCSFCCGLSAVSLAVAHLVAARSGPLRVDTPVDMKGPP